MWKRNQGHKIKKKKHEKLGMVVLPAILYLKEVAEGVQGYPKVIHVTMCWIKGFTM